MRYFPLVLVWMIVGLVGGCAGGGQGERPGAGEPIRGGSGGNGGGSGFVAGPDRTTLSRRGLQNLAVETLLELASHENPEIRANALEAMSGVSGHTRSLESVVALGLTDRNEAVRAVAAMVAGKQGLGELIPTLRGMDRDPSPYVRGSVMYAMQMIQKGEGGVDLTPLATTLLENPDIRVSSHAAYLLGELGNDSAIGLLLQASALEWRQTPPIGRRLFRLQVAEALIKLGDRSSLDSVRSALYPSRPEELEATALAVQILGEVKDRGAIDQLIYLVDSESGRRMPVEVRLAAAGALAKLGLSEGGFIADEYAGSSSALIRAQAATVYGRTGRAEHLPKLERLVRDESARVRVGSAGAILEILGGS